MDAQFIEPVIAYLQTLPAEITSFILFGVSAIAILLLLRLLGAQGLYIYNIVAVLASNIQVLKSVTFSFGTEPVALGTVLFASTYLCSDILTEQYGKEVAKRGVWYCFAAQILMTLFMIIAVGYPKLSLEVVQAGQEHLTLAEQAIALLFTPSPRILLASLLAFAISQLNDIWVFQWISKRTHDRLLWLRTLLSGWISAVVDTVIFSVLAWVVLAPNPVNFSTLMFTYIIATVVTRAIIAILSTPVMYISKVCMPPKNLSASLYVP